VAISHQLKSIWSCLTRFFFRLGWVKIGVSLAFALKERSCIFFFIWNFLTKKLIIFLNKHSRQKKKKNFLSNLGELMAD